MKFCNMTNEVQLWENDSVLSPLENFARDKQNKTLLKVSRKKDQV